ncbi:GNAT family protein [Amycolatopsis endophytica]|uniref:RimJ/RimL family protein N-acetyltransferase n=1 Tax=Amycolatopsis endophytica TaxID=860233 RepID=A0A853BEK1_9PSEU|nr:GNAT family protein [Amycolatopsis endophytica]NYI92886.1 RimJ/RimL family protein N-acetyltransferase [Amycolatopsis endophytica]
MLEPAYPIKTARLILRPFTQADLGALHSFQSRPDVARYLYWEPRTRQETAAALKDKITRSTLTEPGEYLSIAVELIDTGELIGDLTLSWTSREHASGEFGLVFHPEHHGKGYAAEAATELFRLGFDGLGLHRIHGRCDSRNVPSASLMEGLGMRREAHLRENELVKGEWTDELVYAMLSAEWKRR